MAKFFSFSSREVPITFFEGPAAVTVRLKISDETDKASVRGAELLKQGTEAQDISQRKKLWTEAVDALMGAENREKITALMEKGELPGKYALFIDDTEHALCLEDSK